jgi:AraC-like DNA-binding protein
MPDPSVFSRTFRRAYGISPSGFRAEARAGLGPLPDRRPAGECFGSMLRRLRA